MATISISLTGEMQAFIEAEARGEGFGSGR